MSTLSLIGQANRNDCHFKEDPQIPEIFRSTLHDYNHSGFDRGHLAPAANRKRTNDELAETFYLSNICPQVPQFNRGYWAKLEKYVRNLTEKYGEVEVFTGPLYLPKQDDDGKKWAHWPHVLSKRFFRLS